MRTIFLFLCFIASISTGYTQQDDYFITTWNTEEGDPGNATIKLPISGGYYDVDINYDGNFDADMTNLRIPTIIDFGTGNAGIKTIAVRPNPDNNPNNQLRISHSDVADRRVIGTPQKLISIDKWGDIVWTSMVRAFWFCSNMTLADDAGVPDLSMVTDMSFAFTRATSFAGNLSGWDVSNVTNMLGTFSRTTSFTSDLERWDVSAVTDMNHMFSGASNFKSDISTWDVSAVTDMKYMFSGASNFKSDISTWDVSAVTDMTEIFRNANSFKAQDYNALLVEWSKLPLQRDVPFTAPPVTYCATGQAGRNILTGTYNWTITGDGTLSCPFITTWDTEKGDNQTDTTIKLPIISGTYDVDVNNDGDFDDLVDMTNQTGTITVVFETAGIHTIAIRPSAANTENQLQIKFGIIIGQRNQQNQPQKLKTIEQWGSIVWTSMEKSFYNCMNMTISNNPGAPNLSMVKNMSFMFSKTRSLTGDLSTWDVSNVTAMTNMFMTARKFTSDLSSWNVSKVTDMSNMFLEANSFKAQDYDALLAGWARLPSLQPNVTFGAPPTTYCVGKAGRDILTSAPHNWNITGDMILPSCEDLAISIMAFLQGPYDAETSMMSDGLRVADIIPAESPYGDGATVERTVFDDTTDPMDMENNEGQSNIVDWVEVSLHNPNDVSIIITTVPALLQRDGKVVALDGSDLVISGTPGDYKVSINHRNHIPVITDAAQSLSATETAIDFTNDLTIVTGGSNAMAEVEADKFALFSGDVNQNGQVQVDDYNAVIQDVGRGGYLTSDVDMNGELQVSDANFVLKTLGKGKQF